MHDGSYDYLYGMRFDHPQADLTDEMNGIPDRRYAWALVLGRHLVRLTQAGPDT